jgi:hypothetical protein
VGRGGAGGTNRESEVTCEGGGIGKGTKGTEAQRAVTMKGTGREGKGREGKSRPLRKGAPLESGEA